MAGRGIVLLLSVLFAASVGVCHGAAAAPGPGYVTVSTASFVTAGSASTCNSPDPVAAPTRNGTSAVLRLTHRHGPCAPSRTSSLATPSVAAILRADQRRAEYILNRVSGTGATKQQQQQPGDSKSAAAATVPASWGYGIGTLNYVVTVSLGTPGVTQTLEMDTGSDLSWVQCAPCAAPSCYAQKDPLFDPAQSSTYAAVPCGGAACAGLGFYGDGSCTTQCGYVVRYGDSSNTTGVYSSDTLALTPQDKVSSFFFGCGRAQAGLFTGIDGLMGLGRQAVSLVQQTVAAYGGAFSYCLPTTPTAAGYLTLGRPSTSGAAVATTQLLSSPNAPFYYIVMMTGVSVGGKKLDVPRPVFAGGVVVDSGTVVTRLPPTAYAALRAAFRAAMAAYGYPTAPPTGILDTCYNFTGYGSVTLPTVALAFGGGASVTLGGDGILSFGCLAFATTGGEDGGVAILGNVQQRSFEVRFDASSVGFKPNSC
ncbi:hypothetical protein QOZ80_2AG0143700 [Eleusine coracana subsp. coracana]|nr:hypothetical protein QOZ80_2AG0143700 [Eleusine coracana subsp. coracana]